MTTQDLDRAIERAGRLRTTLATDGWKDIEVIIRDKREELTRQLINEKDLTKMPAIQANIASMDYLTSEIMALIQVGLEAEKRKKKKR